MMRLRGYFGKALTVAVLLAISACQPAGTVSADRLASGKLLSIGKKNLVMQNESHVMFVSLDGMDRQSLKLLEPGENITLLGKRDVIEKDSEQGAMSADVYEIMKEDGTRIALNGH